jgi:hypothetical protein
MFILKCFQKCEYIFINIYLKSLKPRNIFQLFTKPKSYGLRGLE